MLSPPYVSTLCPSQYRHHDTLEWGKHHAILSALHPGRRRRHDKPECSKYHASGEWSVISRNALATTPWHGIIQLTGRRGTTVSPPVRPAAISIQRRRGRARWWRRHSATNV